jgi:NAD(P)-dependent dehydrogenase (short-subunit alcohol dehydrogenase family)
MHRLEGKVAMSPARHRGSAKRVSNGSVAKAPRWSAPTSAMAPTCAATRPTNIFFANAGISGGFATIAEQSAADWAEILRVNLIGPFLAIKYAAPIIAKTGGGSISCTASVAGLRSGAGGAAYSASKAGVINLVQTAAQQLSGSGVRVNAICPGLIETGMTRPLYDAARATGHEDRIGELNPLKRGGEPREIAEAALFLASDASSYVNGSALVVDGGLASSHPTTRRFDLRML